MKAETKKAWVAALRSGDYLQCKTALRFTREGAPAHYCCLGVLCELNNDLIICPVNTSIASYKQDPRRSGTVPSGYQGLDKEAIDELITMNDSQGKTFSEIADWIEENIEETEK